MDDTGSGLDATDGLPADASDTIALGEAGAAGDPPDAEEISGFDEAFAEHQGGASGPYETTQRLAKGLGGEKTAIEALASDRHQVLWYKPDISGTNQGGVDAVTMKDGQLYLLDNKAYGSSRNISSVPALLRNFYGNYDNTLAQLREYADDPARPTSERQLYQDAADKLANGDYVRAVTNANPTAKYDWPTDITDRLKQQGIQFINVMPPKGKGGVTSSGAVGGGSAGAAVGESAGAAAAGSAAASPPPVPSYIPPFGGDEAGTPGDFDSGGFAGSAGGPDSESGEATANWGSSGDSFFDPSSSPGGGTAPESSDGGSSSSGPGFIGSSSSDPGNPGPTSASGDAGVVWGHSGESSYDGAARGGTDAAANDPRRPRSAARRRSTLGDHGLRRRQLV